MKIKIIGVDCATVPKKTGLALGIFNEKKAELKKAGIGKPDKSIAK